MAKFCVVQIYIVMYTHRLTDIVTKSKKETKIHFNGRNFIFK